LFDLQIRVLLTMTKDALKSCASLAGRARYVLERETHDFGLALLGTGIVSSLEQVTVNT
jgi:hypothetical protein